MSVALYLCSAGDNLDADNVVDDAAPTACCICKTAGYSSKAVARGSKRDFGATHETVHDTKEEASGIGVHIKFGGHA